MVWQRYLAYTAKAGPGGRRLTRRSASRRQRHHTGENGRSPYCGDSGNRTFRGEIGLEAVPALVYRKLSIPKLDDVNPELDEFRQGGASPMSKPTEFEMTRH